MPRQMETVWRALVLNRLTDRPAGHLATLSLACLPPEIFQSLRITNQEWFSHQQDAANPFVTAFLCL